MESVPPQNQEDDINQTLVIPPTPEAIAESSEQANRESIGRRIGALLVDVPQGFVERKLARAETYAYRAQKSHRTRSDTLKPGEKISKRIDITKQQLKGEISSHDARIQRLKTKANTDLSYREIKRTQRNLKVTAFLAGIVGVRRDVEAPQSIEPATINPANIELGESYKERLEREAQERAERRDNKHKEGGGKSVKLTSEQKAVLSIDHMEALNSRIKPEADVITKRPARTEEEKEAKRRNLTDKRLEIVKDYLEDNGIDASNPAVIQEISRRYLIIAEAHDWLSTTVE